MTKLVFSILLLFTMSFGTVAPLLRLLEDKRYEWVETESEDAADEDSKTESEKAKEKELLAACWPVHPLLPVSDAARSRSLFVSCLPFFSTVYLQLPELPPEHLV